MLLRNTLRGRSYRSVWGTWPRASMEREPFIFNSTISPLLRLRSLLLRAPSTPSIHAFGRYSEATISNAKPKPSTLNPTSLSFSTVTLTPTYVHLYVNEDHIRSPCGL